MTLNGLKNLGATGTLVTLAGAKDAVNIRERPDNVAPVTSSIPVGASFTCTVPGMAR